MAVLKVQVIFQDLKHKEHSVNAAQWSFLPGVLFLSHRSQGVLKVSVLPAVKSFTIDCERYIYRESDI